MKRTKIIFTIFIFFIGLECFANNHLCDDGVSWELAKQRKQEIKKLSYYLYFNIPEQKEKSVEGKIISIFNLDSLQTVIFDFRSKKEMIHQIKMNGKNVEIVMKNDHIILPAVRSRIGKNIIEINFTAGNQSLNRNEDYLYTLFVPDRARTVFPCFDQPNLKAVFSLQLKLPVSWQAVSNTNVIKEKKKGEQKQLSFESTKPLSTYLFSFVAGKMKKAEYNDGKHLFRAYYRETDSAKVAQLGTIFKQVAYSIDWMEKYTGIPYPFQKYDFIILPSFQFGGMEHAGATLYNDRIFLNQNPTPDEELNRTELIAHETAHMWFGDLVTMNWFNDVWTKEVFANYFAALIAEPLFPQINHSLYWLSNYTSKALAQDRTLGTTAIQQPLDNLCNAGLIYGNIVYDKAPVMMKKLVEIIGADSLRAGLRQYLREYLYSNATWDDLIHILKSKTSADLSMFDKAWVKQKGMPVIRIEQKGDSLFIKQHDSYNRGLIWPQRFSVKLFGEKRDTIIQVNIVDSLMKLPVNFEIHHILPNVDGRGYGFFVLNKKDRIYELNHWSEIAEETSRLSVLMTLFENYQNDSILDNEFGESLLKGLVREKNPLVAQMIVNDINVVLDNEQILNRNDFEYALFLQSQNHPIRSCRIQLLRMLIANAVSPEVIDKLYSVWKNHDNNLLSEQDYTNLSYQMAIRKPEQYKSIISIQRNRITNPDRLRQFDFISRAVNPDTLYCDQVFQSLLIAENRRMEPWASSTLVLLNHPCRENYSVKYIYPALNALQEIQKTGDIFFPTNWVSALLSGHRTKQAYQEVLRFLKSHPDYPEKLKNKIMQAAYPLFRIYGKY